MRKIGIKTGTLWKDKKTGATMRICKRHHDSVWHCIFDRGRVTHTIKENAIRRYYEPLQETI